jgi:SAM-dependent methyltransferase
MTSSGVPKHQAATATTAEIFMSGSHAEHHGINLQIRILHELGYRIDAGIRILDFGCGSGETVLELRRLGFDAFGVDIKLDEETPFLRRIPPAETYRIPFPDHEFDFIYSNQVFEHVQDHEVALSEIHRVLKRGGMSLHFFPPKYRPIEPHTFVPLAGAFQRRCWLSLWALMGIRNAFQKGLATRDVADRNYRYLHENTCYVTKKHIRRLVLSRFANVTFAEKQFMKHSCGRARYAYPLVVLCPWLAPVFSSLHQRVVFFTKLPRSA